MKTNVRKDLSGMKFGRWTVLYQADDKIQPSGKHTTMWHCICDCGNEKDVLGSSLKNGKSTSCGCVLKEWLRSMNSKENTYDLTGDYGVCYFNNGGSFIFDLEDYDKLKQYTWSRSGEYASTTRNHVAIIAARILLDVTDDKLVVDHINGNPSDNRKSNLRVVTQAKNMQNRKTNVNNTSGVTGVSFKNGYWTARIMANKKEIFLGIFDNKDDAIKARKKAEEKYFGEMRRQK